MFEVIPEKSLLKLYLEVWKPVLQRMNRLQQALDFYRLQQHDRYPEYGREAIGQDRRVDLGGIIQGKPEMITFPICPVFRVQMDRQRRLQVIKIIL
jgi:hypothetical protein